MPYRPNATAHPISFTKPYSNRISFLLENNKTQKLSCYLCPNDDDRTTDRRTDRLRDAPLSMEHCTLTTTNRTYEWEFSLYNNNNNKHFFKNTTTKQQDRCNNHIKTIFKFLKNKCFKVRRQSRRQKRK